MLGGRDETKLKRIAENTGYTYSLIRLDSNGCMKKGLNGIDAVINVAEPFIKELPAFVEYCIQKKIHFIDLAMDPTTLTIYDTPAKEQDVMILSGVGHAFLPMDCLGGLMHSRTPDAMRLSIYISGMNTMSRGTAKSNIALIKHGMYHRKDGMPFKIRDMKPMRISADNSSSSFVPASFGVATLGFSTSIPSIEVYFEATPSVKPFIFIIKYFSWLFAHPVMQKFLEKKDGKPAHWSR